MPPHHHDNQTQQSTMTIDLSLSDLTTPRKSKQTNKLSLRKQNWIHLHPPKNASTSKHTGLNHTAVEESFAHHKLFLYLKGGRYLAAMAHNYEILQNMLNMLWWFKMAEDAHKPDDLITQVCAALHVISEDICIDPATILYTSQISHHPMNNFRTSGETFLIFSIANGCS